MITRLTQAITHFEKNPAVVYMVDPALTLIWCNLAWDAVAVQNGAPHLVRSKTMGVSLQSVIPPVLFRFYTDLMDEVTEGEAEHIYECSSPNERRFYHMRILPVSDEGFLFVNSLVDTAEPEPGFAWKYENAHQLIAMCVHCRRTQIPETSRWEWVPDLVENMPKSVSHGLCAFCRAYHYPTTNY